jgi:hypothetical protein
MEQIIEDLQNEIARLKRQQAQLIDGLLTVQGLVQNGASSQIIAQQINQTINKVQA